jgi:hypothetical protein
MRRRGRLQKLPYCGTKLPLPEWEFSGKLLIMNQLIFSFRVLIINLQGLENIYFFNFDFRGYEAWILCSFACSWGWRSMAPSTEWGTDGAIGWMALIMVSGSLRSDLGVDTSIVRFRTIILCSVSRTKAKSF